MQISAQIAGGTGHAARLCLADKRGRMAKRFRQVEADVAKLEAMAGASVRPSAEEARVVLKDVEALRDALVRFVARAKETDKEKQVYGPKMCAKVRSRSC